MSTAELYTSMIRAYIPQIKNEFGVRSMCIFGSVARGEENEASDLDVCVEMEADLFKRMQLSIFLQNIVKRPVDVVRRRSRMNSLLIEQIENDGIVVF
ncbi:MAG: nucleotidyltransferase domain-containing protein [Bacteroidaceae bacterium]|nr:nucleotidyltransferase domain-containing protein [Bacteroidaceae bacterium]